MRSLTKLGSLGFFLVFLIPFVNAVTIESGTIIQSNGLNLTFNFTSTRYVESFIVSNNSIYFSQFNDNNGIEHLTFNVTETNKLYLGSALPYFTSSSSTSKTINSTLADNITATTLLSGIDFASNPTNVTIKSLTRTTNIYGGWNQINSSIMELSSLLLEPGLNNITINYAGGGGGTTGSGSSCTPNWSCSDWGVCNTNNVEYRTCTDLNNCGTTTNKPSENQECSYIQNPIERIIEQGKDNIKTIFEDKTNYVPLAIGFFIIAFIIILIISQTNKNNAQSNFFNRR